MTGESAEEGDGGALIFDSAGAEDLVTTRQCSSVTTLRCSAVTTLQEPITPVTAPLQAAGRLRGSTQTLPATSPRTRHPAPELSLPRAGGRHFAPFRTDRLGGCLAR
jgi:hypothetical protein